jgi:hypothetical protein
VASRFHSIPTHFPLVLHGIYWKFPIFAPSWLSESYHPRWTAQEDQSLLVAQRDWGNRWADIAEHMAGRTEDAVKGRFRLLSKIQTGADDDSE